MPTRWCVRKHDQQWAAFPSGGHGEAGAPAIPLSSAVGDTGALGPLNGAEVLLAIDGYDCLVGSFDAAGLDRADPRTLAYALEEELPLSAEQFTADFQRDGSRVTGVAAINDRVAPVLEQLAGAGADVVSITPWPLVAWAEAVARDRQRGGDGALVVLQQDDLTHTFRSRGGKLHGWRITPASEGVAPAAEGDAPADTGDPSEQPPGETTAQPAAELAGTRDPPSALDELGRAQAVRMLRGETAPAFELLRGDLRRWRRAPRVRPATAAAAAAFLVLAVCVAGVCWQRAEAHHRLVDACHAAAEEAYRRVFPGRQAPVGLLGRLESVARGLQGQSGAAVDPTRGDGLRLLADWFEAIPEASRVRLLELRMENARIVAEMQARSYTEAEALAAALRRAGFQVQPPRSQQLAGKGVATRITAKRTPAGPASQTSQSRPSGLRRVGGRAL